MAGEKKGKAYEAFVKLALEHLRQRGAIKYNIFWDEKPDRMTIVPDLTIGKSRDEPNVFILVTHSGSAKNSDMKYWRNMGELAESKVSLPLIPQVYNIAFDSVIKETLKLAQTTCFDGQLIVGDLEYGKELQTWIEKNLKQFPKDKDDKVAFIAEQEKIDRNLEYLLQRFKADLKILLRKKAPKAIDALWDSERHRSAPIRVPSARKTFVRRGISKLLLIPDLALVNQSSMVLRKDTPKHVAAALIELNLANKSIPGLRITDPEMIWVLKSFSLRELKTLHRSRYDPRMREWIDTLMSLPAFPYQLSYIEQNWGTLITSEGLYKALRLCKKNPSEICSELVPKDSQRVWLFHLLIEWIKLCRGGRTSYGLAKLVSDLAAKEKDPEHVAAVELILGRKAEWHAKHTIGLGLTDWHGAPSKQHFPLTSDDLVRVSTVLSERLLECPKPDAKKDAVRIKAAIIQTTLEAKLLTYRSFKPIEALLKAALKKEGLHPELSIATSSCLADYARACGHKLDPRSSGTTVILAGKTLIDWQSCSDAGRDHKKKELCGRAVALRYSWDAKAEKFIPRPGIEKLILLLDGTWRQDDLNALARAGWDEIYYPDEIEALAKAIV